MGDGIILNTGINLSGFTKGSKQLMNAITSMSNKVNQLSKNTQRMAMQAASPLKRMIPLILGVGSAYGVISKAVSAFMSQNQQLSAQMSSIWTALGNVLGPIITQIINWVTTAVSYFLSFLKLLGVTAKSASELSKSAGGAASDLKKTIAGFDELNLLNDNSGGGGRVGGAGLKDIEPSEWMQKLADLLKNKMWDEAADMIIEKFNELIHIFATKAEEFGHKAGEYIAGAVTIIGRVLNEVNWHELGEGIANFFNGVLEEINKNHSGEHIGEILVAGITIAIKMVTGFLENLNPAELATTFNDIVMGALQALIDAIQGADWQQIGNNIKTFLENVDWKGIGDKIGELLETAWNAAWELLLGVMGKGTDDELPIVKKFEGLKEAIERFAQAAEPLITRIIEIIKELGGLVGPILDMVTGAINTVSSVLETAHGIIEGTITGADVWEKIKQGWDNFVNGAEEATDATNELGDAVDAVNEKAAGASVNSGGYSHSSGKFGDIKAGAEEASSATEELSEKTDRVEMTADAIEQIGDAAADAQEKVSAASEQIGESADEWSQLKDSISDSMDGISDSVEENFDSAQTTVDDTTESIRDAVENSFEEMKDTIEKTMEDIKKAIEDAWDECTSTTESALSELSSIVDNELSMISSNAYTWGADMGNSFADGIYASAGAVYAACYEIASIAQSILGFSEPEIGPLSNFHTSGPDMMKLFASGIKSESGTVARAVTDVAEVVSDAFGGSEFAIPSVAAGTFLPYGIGSSTQATGFGGDFLAGLKDAISSAVVDAVGKVELEDRSPKTAILNINGREFYRATFYDQQAVSKEHGISLITK